jgi:hypothetical protein
MTPFKKSYWKDKWVIFCYFLHVSWICLIVLAHWNNSPRRHVAPLGHIIPIPCQLVSALSPYIHNIKDMEGWIYYFTEYCEYKGVRYSTGQKWRDGCDYNCVCVDGNSEYLTPLYSQYSVK